MTKLSRRAALAAIPVLSATAASGRALGASATLPPSGVSKALATLLRLEVEAFARYERAGAAVDRLEQSSLDPKPISLLGVPVPRVDYEKYAAAGGEALDKLKEDAFAAILEAEAAVYSAPIITLADAQAKAQLAMQREDLKGCDKWVGDLIRTLVEAAA
ncbi:hypothetical protein NGM99_12555 [Mesorhizobium sp. RP14(2022)]|uniref:DUF885 domain-containing protein n=1 Tax=Mesorhizobium liriopis TaxID=2953882 RepID=A0ABT1C707_9HYPH|nr:hypothetical protein [Mesorhizobium liriopis]MCO6050614.1 hypothetical protein [Mesorhizobium liriopis]